VYLLNLGVLERPIGLRKRGLGKKILSKTLVDGVVARKKGLKSSFSEGIQKLAPSHQSPRKKRLGGHTRCQAEKGDCGGMMGSGKIWGTAGVPALIKSLRSFIGRQRARSLTKMIRPKRDGP